MKNPRAQYTISSPQNLISAGQSTNLGYTMGNPGDFFGKDVQGDAGWDSNPVGDPSELEKTLTWLKFDPKAIADITKLAGLVTKIASVVGWVMIGIETTKKVLEFLGVLDAEEDATKQALEAIKARVEQLYIYLLEEEEEEQYKEAMRWRSEVSLMRNALANLALSRSASNLDTLKNNSQDLMRALEEMLAPRWGDIPVRRATYGYQPGVFHWLDGAYAFYMQTTAGVPVPDYGWSENELKMRIFDPGYYLDVLVNALVVRTASLAALEPAFRSTGYDRENLRTLYAMLGAFIDKWNQSFLRTTVEGPIHPVFGNLSNLLVYQPRGIPMGVIDPVSGVASFVPEFSKGFALHWNQWSGPQGQNWGGYWTVTNIPQAIAGAYAHRSALLTIIRARSGINRMYQLRHDIGQLMSHATNVELSSVTFQPIATRQATKNESLDLGIIGGLAGKRGKKYPATRFFVEATRRFRIPMMRRMDVSQIQLGYRVLIEASGADADLNLVLCDYSVRATPNPEDQSLPLFPKDPITAALRTDKATVYTVVQNDHFSARDEESWEANGTVTLDPPKKQNGVWISVNPYVSVMRNKQRLFIDPRVGKVALKVDITFSLDMQNPEQSFVGYANVAVTNLQPETNRDGVILHITVYETVVSSVTNNPEEMLADSMTLHLVPSYLLVDNDYFEDREAGYKALGSIVEEIEDDYSISVGPGPKNPIWQMRHLAEAQAEAVQRYTRLAEQRPEAVQAAVARRFPPAVQQSRKRTTKT